MSEIRQNINKAYVFLREKNNTIPSDHLDMFKQVLEEYFDKQEQCKDGVCIVPIDSAKFCANKTIANMQSQIADFGDNESLRNEYLAHAKALHFNG